MIIVAVVVGDAFGAVVVGGVAFGVAFAFVIGAEVDCRIVAAAAAADVDVAVVGSEVASATVAAAVCLWWSLLLGPTFCHFGRLLLCWQLASSKYIISCDGYFCCLK